MQSMKDAATNVTSSAKAGLEKTKATAQEQVEKMQSRDPLEKEMAARKKDERVAMAEHKKLEERERAKYEHAAAGATGGGTGYSPIGTTGHGIGHPTTTTGETHPLGGETGTTKVGLGHNTRSGAANQGRGTGTGGI